MDATLQDTSMNDPGLDSEEDEELSYILDEVDGAGASFQKFYTRFKNKFKSIKRAKAKHKKQKDETCQADPEPVADEHQHEMKIEPSPKPAVDEHEYDFCNPHRGMAIIINNERFLKEAEMRDRKGSGNDASALEEMFKHLGFDVKRHDDLTVQQMVQKLEAAASNTIYDHSKADCFTCAILSHGAEEMFQPKKLRDDPTIRHDVVFGVDGKMVPTRYLLSIFNDECCPELEGKPRLFFIQACRGGKFDEGTTMTVPRSKNKPIKKKVDLQEDNKDAVGVVAESESEEESDSEYHDAEESLEPQDKPHVTSEEQKKTEDKREEKQTTEQIPIGKATIGEGKSTEDNQTTAERIEAHTVQKGGTRKDTTHPLQGGKGDGRSLITVSPSPIYKDFLLMYAAPPGYFAWRRDSGGWLIQTLKKVLISDIVTNQSLTNILTKVTCSVAMNYESQSSKRYLNTKKLVPCVMSMLTKDYTSERKWNKTVSLTIIFLLCTLLFNTKFTCVST